MKALILLALLLAELGVAGQADLLVADFEGANYGDWQVTGEAFGPGPAHGTLPGQMTVDGFLGRGLVNSFFKGDGATGTLTSPPFEIQRHYLRFLIGGGGYPDETYLGLLIGGQTVRKAVGPNTRPGGSERLDWQEWDAREFAGRQGVIQVVDRRTGGWGHINVDHILQTDQPLPGVRTNATREFVPARRYLNLPVKNGAPKRLLSLIVNGEIARQFEIELAEGAPDWWAFLDLAAFQGRRVAIQIDRLREDSRALEAIEQSDGIKGAEELYREKLRPQFHFSARRGWNNDPNGLVYYAGEYHLFFQHNPYGWHWGNMHWGHAVSADLVRWRELPIALYPDRLGTVFSGSAVVDEANTSGFQRGAHKPLVCIYTAAGGTSAQSQGQPFTQCLAYSTDGGRTFMPYAHNPVLGHIKGGNRDPKVIWHAPTRRWIMALYLDGNDYALFESPDLKQWRQLCEVALPGASECPEFFEIPVDENETRWVFYGGNGRYLVGRFDGLKFTRESGPHPLQFGNCFYASQTFNHVPDGRRILVPWGQINLPGMPFNQMMGLPVELTLRRADEGLRLWACPVRELERLRARTHRFAAQSLQPGQNPLGDLRGELWDIVAEIEPGEAAEIGFVVRGVPVTYDVTKRELACRDRKAALAPVQGRVSLRLLVDRVSIDIFGNGGRLYMPMGLIFPEEDKTLALAARGGSARVRALEVYALRSAWVATVK